MLSTVTCMGVSIHVNVPSTLADANPNALMQTGHCNSA